MPFVDLLKWIYKIGKNDYKTEDSFVGVRQKLFTFDLIDYARLSPDFC